MENINNFVEKNFAGFDTQDKETFKKHARTVATQLLRDYHGNVGSADQNVLDSKMGRYLQSYGDYTGSGLMDVMKQLVKEYINSKDQWGYVSDDEALEMQAMFSNADVELANSVDKVAVENMAKIMSML